MKRHSSRPIAAPRGHLIALAVFVSAAIACDSAGVSGVSGDQQEPVAAVAAKTPEAKPDTAGAPASWRAGFVIVDGVYNTELMAPYDVLEHTAYQPLANGGIEVVTLSPDGEEVRTAEGLRIRPDYSFDDAPPIDILVVPSSQGSREADLADARLVSFVRQRGEQARLVVSLCWGAFVLAHSGLLDGHKATTFPADYERFARRFPEVDLRVNVSFVHDGRFLTSQGGALSYDVAMYVVDLVFGEEVAKGVGRGLLLPWPRSRPVAPPPFISDTAFRLTPPTRD